MDYKEKFKKITNIDMEELNKPTKITDFNGKELTKEEVQKIIKEKEKTREKNDEYYESHKDDPFFANFIPRR